MPFLKATSDILDDVRCEEAFNETIEWQPLNACILHSIALHYVQICSLQLVP